VPTQSQRAVPSAELTRELRRALRVKTLPEEFAQRIAAGLQYYCRPIVPERQMV
jgi:hypothetical protein